MCKKQENIITRIIRMDNVLKVRKCSFSRFQDVDYSKKLFATENNESIQDYKELKAGLKTVDFRVRYKKLAFQPVRVHSRYR